MGDKILVTQALDERDLLAKKIADKIEKASFVDMIKPNEDKVYEKRVAKEVYAKEAKAAYQQIMDLIDRFQKLSDLEEKRSTLLAELDTQIKVSNATTFIEMA